MWSQLDSGRVVHRFEWLVLALALAVIPVVVVDEEYPHGVGHTVATSLNWLIWAGFLAEALFVLTVASRKRAALRAHWLDVVIVIVTAPFLPSLLASLRLLRLGRLVRVVRLLRLVLVGWRAIVSEQLLSSRKGFRYIALATAFFVVVIGFGIHLADREDFHNSWRGIYWAIVTVTTVGYGDIVPHTLAGRILASVLMLLGIGFIAVLTAAIASAYVATDAAAGDQADADRDATIAHRVDQAVIEISQAIDKLDQRLRRIETAMVRQSGS